MAGGQHRRGSTHLTGSGSLIAPATAKAEAHRVVQHGTWTPKDAAPVVSIFAAVDYALGRRPYTVEETGKVLVTLDKEFWTGSVHVRCLLGARELVPRTSIDAGESVLTFALSSLPERLEVKLDAEGGSALWLVEAKKNESRHCYQTVVC